MRNKVSQTNCRDSLDRVVVVLLPGELPFLSQTVANSLLSELEPQKVPDTCSVFFCFLGLVCCCVIVILGGDCGFFWGVGGIFLGELFVLVLVWVLFYFL